MKSNKTSKELINCFKDYIDIADASYALLHNVFENEEGELDRLSKKHGLENLPENTINSCKKEEIDNPVWRYADGITRGDILKSDQKDENNNTIKNAGDPTAYALAIEANFMADKIVKKPVGEKGELKDVKLDNDVKNFIYYDKDSKEQRLIVGKDEIYTISPRTKLFVNRYELVKHIPNQTSGFSSTVFYATAKSNYIIGFRGTEI